MDRTELSRRVNEYRKEIKGRKPSLRECVSKVLARIGVMAKSDIDKYCKMLQRARDNRHTNKKRRNPVSAEDAYKLNERICP